MTLRDARFTPTAPWYVRLVDAVLTAVLNARARWQERESEQLVVVDVEARGWVETRKSEPV